MINLTPQIITDAEAAQLENDLDDACLGKRILNISMGASHPDLQDDTVHEQAELVLATIHRQLTKRDLSAWALGHLTTCLGRYLENEAKSLDEAFYVAHPKKLGGQPVRAEIERATVRAYMTVINQSTRHIDPFEGECWYSEPSKKVRDDACYAAFLAYRDASGKDNDEFNDPIKKINQTIKPLLLRLNVLR